MLPLILAAAVWASLQLPPPPAQPPEPKLILASLPLTGAGLATPTAAAPGVDCGNGTLDLSTGCSNAVLVVF